MKRYERQDLMKIVADNGDGMLLSQAWGNEPRDILAIAALAADAVAACKAVSEAWMRKASENPIAWSFNVDIANALCHDIAARAAALATPAGQEAVP